ncbi:TetR/AcrR family transcriptional regulator [Pyruvatibacter mobilis]|uniref:TetR/AcrR family transcriptional regulator n=1 Tax=Pyruvatibacter mobilis TaxID=1712261 RepID=UPI003BB01587
MPKIVDHKARRAELVEASWKVIETEGLDGLTMRKVASAAGCTTGRITHYFPDREALVLAALRAANEAAKARTTALLAKDLPPRARLQKCVEEGLPLDRQRQREWKVWIAF